MTQDFKDLKVWQKAMDLSECIYRLTKTFPNDEQYGLVSQLRRAAVSVASNIAEGRGRTTEGDFRQFLSIAQGSTYEVHTQLLMAKRLAIGDAQLLMRAEATCIETSKMLRALIASVGTKARG